jgi:hypothetical protein
VCHQTVRNAGIGAAYAAGLASVPAGDRHISCEPFKSDRCGDDWASRGSPFSATRSLEGHGGTVAMV